ncbi:hypothetical protein Scep_015257 [Stephania cephalantha]|uniref:Uncharacterized protein n=1 Tax=Stephania cephalantha TaxID=152367 RepID=A0AAP0J2N9_9MAGN
MLRVYDNDEIFARKCFVLPNLAYIVHSSGEMIRSSLRLRFGLLILVATVTTLTCRIAVRRGFVALGGVDNELLSVSGSVAATTLSSLNTTFLKLAAVDIGEAKERKEVEQLLEGNFGSQLRSRSISSWRRENHLEARPRGSVIGSIVIRTPKYFWNWYEFRRVLRDWYRRKRFEPEIMKQLVELVKGPIDRHYGFSNSDHRYGSCAVVGNSGILLQSEYGKLIDSHEAVIRLNNARIKGFERSVGSKTSISFVNSNILHLCARREGCFCHPYGDNVPLVMYICQPVHFMDYTICNSTNKSPLLITDSRFDLLCSRIVKYYSLKEFVEETGSPRLNGLLPTMEACSIILLECKLLCWLWEFVIKLASLGLENRLWRSIIIIQIRRLSFIYTIMRRSMRFTEIWWRGLR